MLAAPNYEHPFKFASNASDMWTDVLLKENENTVDHSVAYFSEKFNAQRNYVITEKELLVFVSTNLHFYVYLDPHPGSIIVYTDHKPLKYLCKFRNDNQWMIRWSLNLHTFNLRERMTFE